ncbi:MAG TPA: GNAT family N-acetyltransferase [Acidimicrobiales bacterium]|nr:GNAT family N-acetyltransferase [Acidimicrobiales bacterium]
MAVEIEPAVPAQFPAVLSFWAAATEVASSTDDLDGLTALWQRDPEALLVAIADGVIVGSLIAAWDGWRAGFYRLAVDPAHRRQGVGRALVAEGESRLGRRGARRVSLFAITPHERAVGFWRALGYDPDPLELRFVKDLTQSH